MFMIKWRILLKLASSNIVVEWNISGNPDFVRLSAMVFLFGFLLLDKQISKRITSVYSV
jgi:hypothetical protein